MHPNLLNVRTVTDTLPVTTTRLLPDGLDLTPAKHKLFEVALRLFGDRGYHAVSLRDIADELGQQPSAIYFHMGSKLELLFELALIGHRMHLQAVRDALMDAGRDPRDQLAAVMGAHVTVHLDYPAMARLTNRELRALSPEQLEEVLTIRRAAEQVTIDVLERGVRMGVFHVDDTFLAARALGAIGIRIAEWWDPEAGERTREEILEHYVAYALKLTA
jgi:AcrR family transcriptional regulator